MKKINKKILFATSAVMLVGLSGCDSEPKSYSVVWKNYDGTELKVDTVKSGETPLYSGETPTKPSTAEFTYTFKDWSPAIEKVTSDQVYTATFNEIKNEYKVTWDIEGNKTEENYKYGETPTYKGETPTKPESGIYKYQFAGWTPEFEVVTGDKTYTANFNVVATASTLNEIVSNAKDGDQIILENSEVAYTLPSTSKELTFLGDPANSENVKIDTSVGSAMPGAKLTFKNLTLAGKTSEAYVGFQHITAETYENCIFTGHRNFYAYTTLVKNCTFKDGPKYFCWVYNVKGTFTFDSCTFTSSNGYAVKIYNENTSAEDTQNVIFNNCTFTAPVDNPKNKPAIAANSLGMNYNVVINNCTATNFKIAEDDAMDEWYQTRMATATDQQKMLFGAEGVIDHITVTIDGTTF